MVGRAPAAVGSGRRPRAVELLASTFCGRAAGC